MDIWPPPSIRPAALPSPVCHHGCHHGSYCCTVAQLRWLVSALRTVEIEQLLNCIMCIAWTFRTSTQKKPTTYTPVNDFRPHRDSLFRGDLYAGATYAWLYTVNVWYCLWIVSNLFFLFCCQLFVSLSEVTTFNGCLFCAPLLGVLWRIMYLLYVGYPVMVANWAFNLALVSFLQTVREHVINYVFLVCLIYSNGAQLGFGLQFGLFSISWCK